jgi:methylglutaconyl-CoA hydratase
MSSILVADAGPIRTITLNRPEHRNALTPEMQRELITALNETSATKSVRVLVITGAGAAFCAGLHLATLKNAETVQVTSSASAFEMADDAHRLSYILRTLYELPIPTIAAVNGHALGGGAGIASVCDFTVAVTTAKFGYPEVKIGFVPALVSAYLALLIGEKRSRDLLLTGRVFGAAEAFALGLASAVVAPEELAARVEALATALVANSPTSLRATKSLLADQHRAWLDSAILQALEASAASRLTPDFREGITAFLEKRKPVWPE